MMRKVYEVSAFTLDGKGGNLAGVVLDADGLQKSDMQLIAKEASYSETAFVQRSDKADFKVRFFTPTSEVKLCGHATIATFNTLLKEGLVSQGSYTQETKAGILKLIVKHDMIFMQQAKPIFYQKLNIKEVEDCFDNLVVDTSLPIQILSTGVREIFLPVDSVTTLNNLKPNLKTIEEVSRKYDVIGIHVFTLDTPEDAHSRNFAPLVGIDEESATGTSNGALSCYIHKYAYKQETYDLRQGYSMNLPSQIIAKVTTKNNEITDVYVGGKATVR